MHLQCETCGAAINVDPTQRTSLCPYCASPAVVERPPSADRPNPVFTVGFLLGADAARDRVRAWLGSRGFFAPSALRAARVDGAAGMRGIYVPAYLYTALARSAYSAEIGENYTETETYTTTDAQGRSVTATRTVIRTEYRHLEGQHAEYVMDVLVTASRGLGNAELEAVEPFDLKGLRRYTPALLSGWIAEEPTLSIAECIALARGEALAKVGQALAGFMPGDGHRNLAHRTTLERETADLLHVPVWVFAVRHDPKKPPVRVLVNGQTGKVVGRTPTSWIKVVVVVGLGLAALALLFLLLGLLGQR